MGETASVAWMGRFRGRLERVEAARGERARAGGRRARAVLLLLLRRRGRGATVRDGWERDRDGGQRGL